VTAALQTGWDIKEALKAVVRQQTATAAYTRMDASRFNLLSTTLLQSMKQQEDGGSSSKLAQIIQVTGKYY
jgi:hypothetical protein